MRSRPAGLDKFYCIDYSACHSERDTNEESVATVLAESMVLRVFNNRFLAPQIQRSE